MGEEREVRVGEVAVREVRRKVPEGAVVRFADEGDPANEGFGRFGSRGNPFHETEAVRVLVSSMVGQGSREVSRGSERLTIRLSHT